MIDHAYIAVALGLCVGALVNTNLMEGKIFRLGFDDNLRWSPKKGWHRFRGIEI